VALDVDVPSDLDEEFAKIAERVEAATGHSRLDEDE
jgi:hypothetical protein